MIEMIQSHCGGIHALRDSVLLKYILGPNAGRHEQLRCFVCSTADDDLTFCAESTAVLEYNAGSSLFFVECDARNSRIGDQDGRQK